MATPQDAMDTTPSNEVVDSSDTIHGNQSPHESSHSPTAITKDVSAASGTPRTGPSSALPPVHSEQAAVIDAPSGISVDSNTMMHDAAPSNGTHANASADAGPVPPSHVFSSDPASGPGSTAAPTAFSPSNSQSHPATDLSAAATSTGPTSPSFNRPHPPPSTHFSPQPDPADIAEARAALLSSLSNVGTTAMLPLEHRAADIAANNAALAAQQATVHAATADLAASSHEYAKLADEARGKLKELGDVQNWAEVLERDLLVLEETMRMVEEGEEGVEPVGGNHAKGGRGKGKGREGKGTEGGGEGGRGWMSGWLR